MLASLYNGNVHVWNTETQTLVKSFEVCDLPVRCARFVARKSWIVVGSDDMQVYLHNALVKRNIFYEAGGSCRAAPGGKCIYISIFWFLF